MVWATWVLLSCKAEDLRIHLPPTGLAALSQEDLERDVWKLGKDSNDSWYFARMKNMGLKTFPIQNGICVGEKKLPRVSVIRHRHPSLDISMAVQISLAKVQQGFKVKYSFCVYDNEVESKDWFLGDMSGLIIRMNQQFIDTRVSSQDINYPKIFEHTRKISSYISLLSD